MLKSEMYKYTFVKTASFMSGFIVNKHYNHGAFCGRAGHILLVIRRGEISPLQPMRGGNGLFCKLKLNICFLREKVWFIK